MYGDGVFISDLYHYRGMVADGLFDGFGRYEDKATDIVYEGNFKEGVKFGFGMEYGKTSTHFY